MFGLGLLGKLFGSSKAGEKIVDGTVNALDKLFYTKEEKAEDQEKREIRADAMRAKGFDVYMKWLESTTGSRIARRIIALMVTGIWTLEHLTSIVMDQVSVFSSDAEKWIVASQHLTKAAADNSTLVGVVLLFYFGGPVGIEGVKGMVTNWVDRGRSKKEAP